MKTFVACILMLLSSLAVAADNNIVIVVDTSGSMEENMSVGKTRMEVTKSVLVSVLKDLPPSTHVGIVSFRGWVYEFGPVDKQRLELAISEMQPYGGTPLWEYIKAGADKLLDVRKKNNNSGIYKLVVATDGEASDEYLADRGKTGIGYLTDIKNRGIVIDAIGVDMAQDHKLATQVNGSYMRGDDPTSLRQAVERAVAEVKFDDVKSDLDFKAIADLPEEFASGAVAAVATYQNQPIGTEPSAEQETSAIVPAGAAAGGAAPVSGGILVAVVLIGVVLLVGFFIFIAAIGQG